MEGVCNGWGGITWGTTAACLHAREQTRERWRMEEAARRRDLSPEAIDDLAVGGQPDSHVESSSIHAREV